MNTFLQNVKTITKSVLENYKLVNQKRAEFISEKDSVLLYGNTNEILDTIKIAKKDKSFTVILVGKNNEEQKYLVGEITKMEIPITFANFNALPHAITKASKVILTPDG